MYSNQTIPKYFQQWMRLYKKDAVRDVTYRKYESTLRWLRRLCLRVTLRQLDRPLYQSIINAYAQSHEQSTVMEFHHQIRAALLDALEDGLIAHDPTRKAIIKGRPKRHRKQVFLNKFELQLLLRALSVDADHPMDGLVFLIAKTGLRFGEALGVTPQDFDFQRQTLSISKAWNYKTASGGFCALKNASSRRKVRLDWSTCSSMKRLCDGAPADQPLFVRGERVFNATANEHLKHLCLESGVPVISIHGLRHTHASLLLYAGVSVASVSRRLGHANMATTQKTYLHIIRELETTDTDKAMRFLSEL
ncbi:MAG: site-specific integrase [Aeriscardovia sp.]|nr:site-specific integrase [Aeriscardovia sp.]